MIVNDDGGGIADPAVLLSFGENGWSDIMVEREDAAGMGMLSLARCGCTVESAPRQADGVPIAGWRVELRPEHFLGETDAVVEHADDAPWPHGTKIAFPVEDRTSVESAASVAARHFPLRVSFLDMRQAAPVHKQLERRAFLDGALHSEKWRGVVFGVFRDRLPGYYDPNLNFFGQTLQIDLPATSSVFGGVWHVLVDVIDCPDLELVLPARRTAVENAFLAELREAARLAIYRAMAKDPAPRVSYTDWKKAAAAGIDIPPTPPLLRPWTAPIADHMRNRRPPDPVTPGAGALLMKYEPATLEGQALARAADATVARRLFETEFRLQGFEWYDALAGVRRIETTIESVPLEDWPAPAPDGTPHPELPDRPDKIVMTLFTTGDQIIGMDTDLAFAGDEEEYWLDQAMPLVTASSDMTPATLADILEAACFSPSDDSEADSYERQLDDFREQAIHMATRLLVSDDEARRRSIADAVRHHLFWLIPEDCVIAIIDREVTVTLQPRETKE